MGGPVQPLVGFRARLGRAGQEFSGGHPLDALTTLMGHDPEPTPAPQTVTPIPPQWAQANRVATQQALDEEKRSEQPRRRLPQTR